ncbi:hypothetical protein P7G31_11475 [Streptococcus parauberis]|uniref:Uncharacterized protein n=1 Tax=Streptococcus parauberis TaxID=1348 RepID=A0AAE4HZL6_9STRE|nr:hypothetical protein [Streptococcus parauberis]MDT2732818.1 hypothetical protein [Streptococcus parauberis]
MNKKQKEIQEKVQKIQQKKKKVSFQERNTTKSKNLKQATKPYHYSQHYSIGFN